MAKIDKKLDKKLKKVTNYKKYSGPPKQDPAGDSINSVVTAEEHIDDVDDVNVVLTREETELSNIRLLNIRASLVDQRIIEMDKYLQVSLEHDILMAKFDAEILEIDDVKD